VSAFLDYDLQFWVLGLGLFITLCQCLAQIWSNGSAFRVMFSSGIIIPIYSVYPITFRDLSGTLFKLSIIQLPLFLLYTTTWGALLGDLIGSNLLNSVVFGFKAGLLIFATKFITTVMAFSGRTNDMARFRVRTIALLFSFLTFGLLFLVLSGAGLFVPNIAASWLLTIAGVFDAYLFLRIYGWFYNATRFDLMSFPRR
jgi:hypothetical protein